MNFETNSRRRGGRPERLPAPGPIDPPRQRRPAPPRYERCRPVSDSPSGLSQREELPNFDWDATVELYASDVWKRARNGSTSGLDAMEVFQLVWLRLELLTRTDPAPEHLCDWLLQEVDNECSQHPHRVE